jgi:NAD(P)-dependent dehydrogenase (short-subunit alcohol dehydrogenase family)
MEAMRATVLERWGRIDMLVAAAGIRGSADPRALATVATMAVEDWDAVLRTNLRGVFLSNRAVIPAMLRQRDGTIINIASSRGGLYGSACAAAYCASKFGVIGLTEALAEELGPHGIRVTAILPDVVDTPMLGDFGRAMLGPSIPPERVAQLVVELVTMPEDVQLVQPLIAPMMNSGRPFGIPARDCVLRRAPVAR